MLRSLWLQWTGVFCSKPDDWCGNGTRVTQITSGANAPGAWGQTGANTANFVRSSLQSEGLLGAQCHLHMLGPFGKVPDRVTGAIFHALVQCVAPRGVSALPNSESHLSANCRGICFRSSPLGFVGHLFAGLSSQPQVLGLALSVWWAHLNEAALRCLSCLRSYCQPVTTPSQGKALPSSGSHLQFFLILPLLSPFSFYPIP